jgi:hypothetical protein
VAGVLIISGLAWIALKGINRNAPAPIPDMANVGNPAAAGGQGEPPPAAPTGAPPDLGSLSPVERFNRLYDRVMRAASSGNAAEARQFLPMALMAYGMLDTLDADLRYHAAVLHAEAGQYAEALALADTILATAPDHLFGYLVQGEVADRRQDRAASTAARQAFASVVEREVARTDRPEYREHRAVIDAFKAAP